MFYSGFGKAIGAVVTAFVIFALIILIGWRVGWWFRTADVQMQRDTNVQSQQYQDGLISQERDRIQAYDTSDDSAQKKQLQMTFCSTYENLVKPPADIQSAHARIC